MSSPSRPDPPEPLAERETRWKILLTQADFWQKILVSFLGAILVGIFYLWQANQSESHYYADLQSEREKADNELRGNMFRTLVDAYLNRKQTDGGKAADSQTPSNKDQVDLSSIEQHILLGDLLARNFETIDIRPLFEDLDRRLASLQPALESAPTSEQTKAFLLRERLRRVARGATSRQRVLLQAAGSRTLSADIKSCPSEKGTPQIEVTVVGLPSERASWWSRSSGPGMSEAATPPTQSLPFSTAGDSGDWVEVRGLSDATVEVKGPFSAKELSQPVNSTFWITYYDMPLLETVRGANGDRISFGIVNYVSPLICRLLKSDESLTASERRDLAERCKDFEQKSCEWAQVAVTVLPRDFIASRDRPYLDQLAKRQRESGIYVFVTGLLIGAFALLAVLAYLLWRRLAPRFKSRLQ